MRINESNRAPLRPRKSGGMIRASKLQCRAQRVANRVHETAEEIHERKKRLLYRVPGLGT